MIIQMMVCTAMIKITVRTQHIPPNASKQYHPIKIPTLLRIPHLSDKQQMAESAVKQSQQ
jgi:hypothetical protein